MLTDGWIVSPTCDRKAHQTAVARDMIKHYGRERAAEYAHGYAVGVYFQQNELGRGYWLEILALIEATK